VVGEIPLTVLDAEDYVLRPFELRDTDAVREASSDPHIPLITSVPSVFTEANGKRYIERQHDLSRPIRALALAERDTNRAIGCVALVLRSLEEGRAALGYWVIASARGHGAAKQGLEAMSHWAISEHHIPRLEAYIEPWNAASIRTAEGAGFTREGLLRSWQLVGRERRDMYMYARIADPTEEPPT
jgi:RimJ/RimL family protein N-acetyltransferase